MQYAARALACMYLATVAFPSRAKLKDRTSSSAIVQTASPLGRDMTWPSERASNPQPPAWPHWPHRSSQARQKNRSSRFCFLHPSSCSLPRGSRFLRRASAHRPRQRVAVLASALQQTGPASPAHHRQAVGATGWPHGKAKQTKQCDPVPAHALGGLTNPLHPFSLPRTATTPSFLLPAQAYTVPCAWTSSKPSSNRCHFSACWLGCAWAAPATPHSTQSNPQNQPRLRHSRCRSEQQPVTAVR